MRVNVFGLGYVGCVSAACLAQSGHDVTGIDVDATKVRIINDGESPLVEPGLAELIRTCVASGKLRATREEIPAADAFIVCVGTPSNENGSLNLTYLTNVVRQIAERLRTSTQYVTVCIRSTVLPGTVEELVIPTLESESGLRAGRDFGISMNPEFLREGTAIHDYHHPAFTLVGELDTRSGDVVAELYRAVQGELLRCEIRVAEMVKYACNAFHAVKVTFANEIGNFCKKSGIDSHKVMDVFCRDTKLNLSSYYLKPGFAFGGSCLPKDLRALLYSAVRLDLDTPLLRSVLPSNGMQIEVAFNLIRRTGKRKIGVLGLSFKAGTDDLRESPMVELAEMLIGKGYEVTIHDREVSLARLFGSNKRYIEGVIPHISSLMRESVDEVVAASEVIVVGTKSEHYQRLAKTLNGKQIIDLVRIDSALNRPAGYDGICW